MDVTEGGRPLDCLLGSSLSSRPQQEPRSAAEERADHVALGLGQLMTAPLIGGNARLHGLNVVAAARPGGLAADVALGGCAHGVSFGIFVFHC